MVKVYEIELKGVAPLLMNRFAIEEHGEGTTKRKKKNYSAQEDVNKALYKNKKGEIYIPGEWVYSALVKAAVKQIYEGRRSYKDIFKAGMVIREDEILDFSPQEYEIDSRAVTVNRARIVRSRPRFDDWVLKCHIEVIHDDLITAQVLKEALDDAGYNGIGDYRPRFGRFMVVGFREVGLRD